MRNATTTLPPCSPKVGASPCNQKTIQIKPPAPGANEGQPDAPNPVDRDSRYMPPEATVLLAVAVLVAVILRSGVPGMPQRR